MFSALLNSPCELNLHLLQSVIFLYPPQRGASDNDNPEAPPNQTDSLVRGLVELYVPSKRHIAGIKVKLRALQTVPILDANSGMIPISWEDEVLMEKELRIGLPPSAKPSKRERGRTPGPSGLRISGGGTSRASSPVASRSRAGSVAGGSNEATARNSPEMTAIQPDEERQGRSASIASGMGEAFVRAISRGRSSGPASRPNSRPGSRSRNVSPSDQRRTNLATFASTSNSAALRNASVAPALLPASPVASPRDELASLDISPTSTRVDAAGSSSNTPAQAHQSDLPAIGSLSIGQSVERTRAANHVGGLGHPDDDDFGIRRDRGNGSAFGTPRQLSPAGTAGLGASGPVTSGGLRGRGGLARNRDSSRGPAGGSVPPPADSSSKNGEGRSSSLGGWGARWSRSVSRARHSGKRETSASPAITGSRFLSQQDRSTSSSSLQQSATEEDWASEPEGIELEKGVHGYEFAFIIPADSPEYTRSPFGRVRYVIKATAYGAGRGKTNVEGWRDCFPVANPSLEGGPTSLTVLYNDIHPTVGVLSIACSSQNISVGGLFQLDVHSPIPPPDLMVYLVKVSLETTIELRSKRKGKQVVPPQRIKLWEQGWVPPRKEDAHSGGDGKKSQGFIRDPAKDGESSAWTVQGLVRMPDDNTIRSSTMHGTKAAIRFSHQLIVEVVHSREPEPGEDQERKLKVFTLRQAVVLPSCCVAFDAATLPAYTPAADASGSAPVVDALPYDLAHLPTSVNGSHTAANGSRSGSNNAVAGSSRAADDNPAAPHRPNTAAPARGAGHEFCVCGLSLQDLEVRERALIPLGVNHDIPIELLRPHGKIGELPIRRSRSRSTSVSTTRGRSRRGSSGSGSGSRSRSGSLARVASRRSVSSNNNGTTTSNASGSRAAVLLRRSLSRSGTNGSTTRDRSASTSRRGPAMGPDTEYQGGSPFGRSMSRNSRLSNHTTHTSSSSTTSHHQDPPPPPTSRSVLEPSVQELPSVPGSAMVSPGEEPPSYAFALREEDEEAAAEEEAQRRGGEEEEEPRGRAR